MPVRYYVNGQKVDVADDKLEAFLQEFPDAMLGVPFSLDQRDLFIPTNRIEQFENKYPKAIRRDLKPAPEPNEEEQFQDFYKKVAAAKYLDPDPKNEQHLYDYRGYFDKHGRDEKEMERILKPEEHFPSEFKDDYHPTRMVKQDGKWIDTKQGIVITDEQYKNWNKARRLKDDNVFRDVKRETAVAESTSITLPPSPRLSEAQMGLNRLEKEGADMTWGNFFKDLYKGTVVGTSEIFKLASSIPAAAYMLGALPQNLLSLVPKYTDELKVTSLFPGMAWMKTLAEYGEKYPKEFEGLERHAPKILTSDNPMYKLYDEIQKDAQANMIEYDNNIAGYLKEGEILKATALTALQIAEAMPLQLMIMAAAFSGIGLIPIMATIGAGSAGEKFTELSAEPKDIKEQQLIESLNRGIAEEFDTTDNTSMITKQINAIIHGSAEGIFEGLGTARLGRIYGGHMKRFGSEVGKATFQRGFAKSFVRGLRNKGVIITDRTIEGIEEFATQVTQNLNDIFTGVNPELNAWSGSFDAFVVGLGASHVTTLPLQLHTLRVQRKIKARIDENIDETIKGVQVAADKEIAEAIKFIKDKKHETNEKEFAEMELAVRDDTNKKIEELNVLRKTLKSGEAEVAAKKILTDNIFISDKITNEEIDQLKTEMVTEESREGLDKAKEIMDPELKQSNVQLWVLQDKRAAFEYGTPEWVAITKSLADISETTEVRIKAIEQDIVKANKKTIKHFENIDTADEQIYELSNLARTVQHDIDEGIITLEEAQKKIKEHGYDPIKMNPEQFRILGSNEEVMIKEAKKDLIKVLGGANPLTVVEERVETFYNKEKIHDPEFENKVAQWKTEYEQSIGEIIKKSDKEWFSTLARRYAAGVEPKGKIHKQLRKILDSIRDYFNTMFGEAQAFAKLVNDGKINEELVEYLDRSINEPTGKRNARIMQMLNPKPLAKPKEKKKFVKAKIPPAKKVAAKPKKKAPAKKKIVKKPPVRKAVRAGVPTTQKTLTAQQQAVTDYYRELHPGGLPLTEQEALDLSIDQLQESYSIYADDLAVDKFVNRKDEKVLRDKKGKRVVKDYDLVDIRNTILKNPNFKKFHKGATLLDADGLPVILYHGTRNLLRRNEFNTSPNIAGWFTTDADFAMQFAGVEWSDVAKAAEDLSYREEFLSADRVLHAKMFPVITSLKNTISLRAGAEQEVYSIRDFVKYLREAGVKEKALTEMVKSYEHDYDLWNKNQKAIGKTEYDMSGWETSGADHVFYSNFLERPTAIYAYLDNDKVGEILSKHGYDSIFLDEAGADTYLIFDNKNIKSLYNMGEWGVKTSDISYDLVPTDKVLKDLNSRFNKRELLREMMAGIPESKQFRAKNRYDVRELVMIRRAFISSKMVDLKELVNTIDKLTTKEERELIPFIIEGVGIPKELNRPDLEKLYNERIKDKDFKLVVDATRIHFDKIWKEMTTYYEDLSYEQKLTYVPHIWDVGGFKGDKHLTITNWFITKNPFLKKRYIATLMEGIKEHGLKPNVLDISELILTHGKVTYRAMANANFVDDVKQLNYGGVPLIASRSAAPEHWRNITHPALRRLKFIPTTGKKEIGMLYEETVKVHPDVEDALLVIFEQNMSNAFWRGYDAAGGVVKKSVLTLSLFHHIALTETAIAMMGWRKTFKIINPISLIYRGFIKGESLVYAKHDIAKDGVIHNLQLGASADFPVQRIQQYLNNLQKRYENTLVRGGITKFISSFNKRWDHALWDWLHDGFKIYAYESQVAKLDKNLSERDFLEAKREIAQLVNDTFGGQNFEILMLNPKVGKLQQTIRKPSGVKAAQRLLLSFDWQVSTLRQAVSPFGLGSLYKTQIGLKTRKRIGRAFWLRAFLYYGIGMNMLNAFFRDRDMEENPEYYQKDEYGWFDYTMFRNVVGNKSYLFVGRYKDGTERYVRWGKQFRELFELFLSDFGGVVVGKPLLKKIGSKIHPLAQKGIELFTGSSMSGFQNYKLKEAKGWDWTVQAAITIAQTPIPFSMRNMIYPHKETKLTDIGMPSARGATRRGLIDYYKYAMKSYDSKTDPKDIEEEIQQLNYTAIQNGIDPYPLFKAALGILEAEIKNELILGKNSIEELEKELAKAEYPRVKRFIKSKIMRKKKEYHKFQMGANKITAQIKNIEQHVKTKNELKGIFKEFKLSPAEAKKEQTFRIIRD